MYIIIVMYCIYYRYCVLGVIYPSPLGQKKGVFRFDPFQNLEHWLHHVYPTLGGVGKPYEIIQEAGQIVYIPEG